MNKTVTNMIISAVLLGLFAVLGSLLVSTTYNNTAEQIAEAERQHLLKTLNALIPEQHYNNSPYLDSLQLPASGLLGGHEAVAYRARRDGEPVAVVITTTAPEGYSGDIRLLVAIWADGRIAGVRVLTHRETPGLGDAIEYSRSTWIEGFNDHSLSSTSTADWRVKKDGGLFDQFTGATITPRAVVKAVHQALLYFNEHKATLFAPLTSSQGDS